MQLRQADADRAVGPDAHCVHVAAGTQHAAGDDHAVGDAVVHIKKRGVDGAYGGIALLGQICLYVIHGTASVEGVAEDDHGRHVAAGRVGQDLLRGRPLFRIQRRAAQAQAVGQGQLILL